MMERSSERICQLKRGCGTPSPTGLGWDSVRNSVIWNGAPLATIGRPTTAALHISTQKNQATFRWTLKVIMGSRRSGAKQRAKRSRPQDDGMCHGDLRARDRLAYADRLHRSFACG